MVPLVLSLVSASLFLMLSSWTYGTDAVLANTWVASVFWALVGSGVVLYVLGRQTSS
jgi:hypothetical protein